MTYKRLFFATWILIALVVANVYSTPHWHVIKEAKAQQTIGIWTGTLPPQMTSMNAAESEAAATVTLTSPSSEVTILATPGGSNVYVNFDGTATTSNFIIPAGYSFTFGGFPSIKSLSVVADGTAGNYAVFAH